MNTRRSFFQNVAMLSAAAALLEQENLAQEHDEKMANFWDAYFNEATRDPAHVSKSTDDADLLDPKKKVQLIQATKQGLRYPDTISDSELSDDTDLVVTVNPGHFRPSDDDVSAIHKSRGCQIRLDWVQTRPIMNLIAPMAWSGLAAWNLAKTTYATSQTKNAEGKVTSTSTKASAPPMPDLKDLDFKDPNDPNAPAHNQVILMGGSGRMALNVRAVSVNNRLQSVLDKSVRYSSIVSPYFGFAPLALPALKAFTELLGAVFNHHAVIMNSMPLQVLASKDATNGPHDTGSVKIVSGDFIAVPGNQTEHLAGKLDKLRVVDGWLVHQDTKPDIPVEKRALDPLVPKVSYVSMSLTVQSLSTAQREKGKQG